MPLARAYLLRGVERLEFPNDFAVRKGGCLRAPLRLLKRSGVEVHVWTINDPVGMRLCWIWGSDSSPTGRISAQL
jgi:hypothetical protein